MLMHVPLPPGAAAANSIVRNEGEMINRGFELNLSSTNIRTNDFEWNTDFNISFNRNTGAAESVLCGTDDRCSARPSSAQ